METCSWKGCSSPATHRPTLRFWAIGHPKIPGKSANAELQFGVCEPCGKALKVDDVVGDEGWQAICAGLQSVGKAMPDRGSLELILEPVHKGIH